MKLLQHPRALCAPGGSSNGASWAIGSRRCSFAGAATGAFLDVDALWQELHCDAAIARMKRMGINLSHIHFHKGYGLEREAASIAEARDWAARLHAAGIRVGAYIGCTFFFETFHHPQVERMLMQHDGGGWGGGQYFRRFWCYNSPEAMEYFKEVIRVAVQEVKADVLHFDNGFSFLQDHLCHCENCLAGFRRYVREEVPEAIHAAGYDSAEELLPPPNGNLPYLAGIESMNEPVSAAWLRYHADTGLRALKLLAEHGRALSPEVAILYNGANLCGVTPFSRPHREMDALEAVDITCVEDSIENPVGVLADGMPVSRFRAYKAGARARTRVCYYTTQQGRDGALMLAEAAAFNYRSLGFVEAAMQANHRLEKPEELALMDYLVRHEELFLDREPWHHIGVVRHHESMLLNPWPSALTPYVVEQALFEAHYPFALVNAAALSADALQREFDLLILPDSKCLSDRDLDELTGYVRQGGRLLVIGNSGAATPLNQYRPTWGFAPLFNLKKCPMGIASRYEETATSEAKGSAEALGMAQGRLGKGEAAYFPPLDFRLPDRARTARFGGAFEWYYHPYWQPPVNVADLLQSIEALLGSRKRVETELPRHVGVEYYRIPGGYRIQMINYRHPAPAPAAAMTLRLPETVQTVEWQTPEGDKTLAVARKPEGAVALSIPSFDLLATMTLRTK